MNNVKRIIAAGLVGTAVISTGVVASAKTYGEDFNEKLEAAKFDGDCTAIIKSFLTTNKITKDQAEKLKTYKADARKIVGDKSSMEELKQLTADEKSQIQKIALKAANTLSLVGDYNTSTGILTVTDMDDNPIAQLTLSQLKTIVTKDDATLDGLVDAAVAMSENGATTVIPGTEDPEPTPDPKPTPDPDKPATETPDTPFTPGDSTTTQEYIDAVNKLKAGENWTDEQVKALEDIKNLVTDMLANGFTLDQLNQAEALLAKLPTDSEQYKTLKATIDYLKTYQNNNGQTAGDAQVEATKTPSNNNNSGSATSGTTAKTATNFGNVAVAGLGLMTVAGTVFVISKKKIQ